ncbi:HD domain-containing protein [Lignipirellula cremea]|uniref:HD domain protein n=1 Tax=Lignipirellula cremea TaxID=2528010 RepID=A0A518DNL1_9BACT|nr:HD domain-containing protein [Lignipirellula cremea]QDU93424.1 HD domain protein [Lignipirellula cremea]
MSNSKLRRQIAWDAARLMYERYESEYFRAKLKAARRICRGWVKPADLPSNAEIRDLIQSFARMHEGDARVENLLEMRLEALRLMRVLERFRPRLIGSVLTGHVRRGSDIDLHLFSDSVEPIGAALEQEGLLYEVERKQVQKNGEQRVFTHIHVRDRFPFELTVYASNKAHFVFKSSITGKAIERASINELEQFLEAEYAHLDLDQALVEVEQKIDRFQLYESLLLPLENVVQSKKYHPEGDALYHSLQVFDLAREELPYDEEFLLAALLHDIGKGIDRDDHVGSGLEALGDYITERTAWLIEHHMTAHRILDGTIGVRAHRRLRESESYAELVLLSECDRDGRQRGVPASELDEALDYLRNLAETFGDG